MILNLLATSLLQIHLTRCPLLLLLFALLPLFDLLGSEGLVALGGHGVQGVDEVAEDVLVIKVVFADLLLFAQLEPPGYRKFVVLEDALAWDFVLGQELARWVEERVESL